MRAGQFSDAPYSRIFDRFLKYSKKSVHDIHADYPTTLHLVSNGGKIQINRWNEKYIRVNATKRAAEKKDLDGLEINFTTDLLDNNESLVCISDIESFNNIIDKFLGFNLFGRRVIGKVDYVIMVPHTVVSASIQTLSDVSVRDFIAKELHIKTKIGRITVQNVQADVTFYALKGTVNLSNITGNITGDVSIGDFQVVDITGSVVIDSRKAPMYMKNINGPIDIKLYRGNVNLIAVKETVDIYMAAGKTVVDNAQEQVNVKVRAGSIELKNIHKGAMATTSSGAIDITRAYGGEGQIFARTLSGQVTVRDSEGRVVASSREVSLH